MASQTSLPKQTQNAFLRKKGMCASTGVNYFNVLDPDRQEIRHASVVDFKPLETVPEDDEGWTEVVRCNKRSRELRLAREEIDVPPTPQEPEEDLEVDWLDEKEWSRLKKRKRSLSDQRRVVAQALHTRKAPITPNEAAKILNDLHLHTPHSTIFDFGLSKGIMSKISKLVGVDLVANKVFSCFENMALLCAGLYNCTTDAQAAIMLALYFKTEWHGSVGVEAYNHAISLFNVEPQSEGTKKPQWLKELRELLKDWRRIIHCPLKENIQTLLSIMVTVGVCKAADVTWSIGSLAIFQPKVESKQWDAFDFTEAIIDTFLFFVESGWECFATGSITPLFFGDSEMQKFSKEFSFLVVNVQHVKTGNLEKMTGIDEKQFDARLTELSEKLEEMYYASDSPMEQKILSDRRTQLQHVRAVFETTRCEGGFRKAPFVTLFWGNSGVGKSTLTLIDMTIGLAVLGKPNSPKHMCTLNDNDKYDSNYRGYTYGVFADDYGNTKLEYVERAPSATLNQLNNNVQCYAVKADVDEKARVDMSPVMFNITSNFPDGGVSDTTNCKESAYRRFHHNVEVKVKQGLEKTHGVGTAFTVETGLDESKLRAMYTDEYGNCNLPTIPDMWRLTVRKAISSENSRVGAQRAVGWEIVRYEGKKLEDIDIFTYLKYKKKCLLEHQKHQEMLEGAVSNMHEKIPVCEKCKMPIVVCECMEPHSGLGWLLGTNVVAPLVKRMKKELIEDTKTLEQMACNELVGVAGSLEDSLWYGFGSLIPEGLYNRYGNWIRGYLGHKITKRKIKRNYMVLGALTFLPFIDKRTRWSFEAYFLAFGVTSFFACSSAMALHDECSRELARRRDALPEIAKRVRDKHLPKALAVGGVVFVAYTAVQIWRGFRAGMRDPQGQLCPTSMEDIKQRDMEKNPWEKVACEKVDYSVVQSSSSYDRIAKAVQANLRSITCMAESGIESKRVCMMMLASNIGVIPQHYWENQTTLEINCVGNNGHTVKTALYRKLSVDIPKSDFSVVYCPALGSQQDLSKFLPIDQAADGQAFGIYRLKDGTVKELNANASRGEVGHMLARFYGGRVLYNHPTEAGMCMTPLLTKGKGTQLIGFHLGGKTGEPQGVYGTLTQAQFKTAVEKLCAIEGVIATHSDGMLTTKVFGHECLISNTPHPKSPVYFMEEEQLHVRVYGECTGRASFYSGVRQTAMSDHVKEVFGVENKWGPPQTRPQWKPWYETLKHASRPAHDMPADLLIGAVKDYKAPLITIVRKDFVCPDVKPLTRMQSVCGIPGKRFIDRMNMSTSMGYPLGGPKNKMLIEYEPEEFPEFPSPADFPEEIWTEVERVEDCYRHGSRAKVIFKACLKDEPTLKTKDKVRVFQCAPISFQLLVRKYFLPVARVLSLFPIASECAVGINSVGPEWAQINAYMETFGENRILAGDYSKYDLRMPPQMTLAAFRILIDLAQVSGNYSAEQLVIMRGLAMDCAYPVVAYDGTLIEFFGTNPSGQNLTVYINSIVNSLLLRCAFLEMYPRDDFRSCVSVMTYGDDVKGSVSMWRRSFNHLTYATFLEKYGIVFTMPDKTSTPTAYMRSKDADFLKRKNVYIPEIGCCGALDENSIFKSLHCYMVSKHVAPLQQQCDALSTAAQEWFYHGRETYDERVEQLKKVAQLQGLVIPDLNLTFDERIKRHRERYSGKTQVTVLDTTSQGLPSPHFSVAPIEEGETFVCDGIGLTRSCRYRPTTTEHIVCNSTKIVLSSEASTQNWLEMDFSTFEPHMAMAPAAASVMAPGKSQSEEILRFADESPSFTYAMDSDPDETFRVADVGDDSLEAFFSRPVKTQSYTWSQSVNFYESFNPWTDFFTNKRVINRISNYNLLRAKLHVKFLINGNGFFYGRLLANYTPLFATDKLTLDRGLIPQDNINASQRPHVYLDPTTNQGGQLDLPFFWYKNALSIPQAEWKEMGQVSLRTLTELAHANGATDSVTISVFVWATDVRLSIPTSVDAGGIVPQMAKDEYGQGMISKPAATVAKISGMLTKAPIIGPYARATEMAASAISQIATIFGYSRPTSVSSIQEFKPTYGGNMATTNLPDTSHKLAIDCKNEVTIDPRVTGLGSTDELDIKQLALRQSYLTNFLWKLADTPEQLLFSARVTPMQYDVVAGGTPSEIHMIPACWTTLPFEYWRGSMKWRFQIVSSNYHKGRLKIVYDPQYTSSTETEYNINYTYVVDIGETKDFTITTGWGNDKPFCTTATSAGAIPGSANSVLNFGTTAFSGPDTTSTNGTISVFVVNELTVPNTTVSNDISINVFASMCDDYEVMVPTGNNIENYGLFAYQSAYEPQMAVEAVQTDEDQTDMPSAPVILTPDTTLASTPTSIDDPNTIIFAGEVIVSLRQLLKRYQFQRWWAPDQLATGQWNLYNYGLPVVPLYRGFTTSFQTFNDVAPSQVTTGTNVAYSYSTMTFMAWIFPAFTGYRGAIRHKYTINQVGSTAPIYNAFTQIARAGLNGVAGVFSSAFTFTDSSSAAQFGQTQCGTLGGGILQYENQNNVFEVEHPYYTNYRFFQPRSTDPFSVNSKIAKFNVINYVSSTGSDTGFYTWVTDYIAGGEDISLYFFTNTPVVYFYGPANNPFA